MTEPTPPTAPASSVRAMLFDLDGTLVDTNYLHVFAWWEAFLAGGHEVSCYDIHRAIGLPSADLVTQLIGREDEALTEGHSSRWEALRPRALAFHGAGELMRACASRGLRVVWATSGTPADLAAFAKLVGEQDSVHATVGSADVGRGKPDPEIVRTAAAAAGVSPAEAVMVGDTTYDVRAAKAAGALAIGLLGGGVGRSELEQAGADLVLGNVQELLDNLDDVLARLAT